VNKSSPFTKNYNPQKTQARAFKPRGQLVKSQLVACDKLTSC